MVAVLAGLGDEPHQLKGDITDHRAPLGGFTKIDQGTQDGPVRPQGRGENTGVAVVDRLTENELAAGLAGVGQYPVGDFPLDSLCAHDLEGCEQKVGLAEETHLGDVGTVALQV